MAKTPKDIRSTGRKRLRAVLFRIKRRYSCRRCGCTSSKRPPDAPNGFENFWPIQEVGVRTVASALQANHINKNLLDCDPANGEWLCASCHALEDRQTAKGVSVIENEFGY